MTKAYSIFLTLACSPSSSAGSWWAACCSRPDLLPMENRNLAKPPKLSWENVESGKFMSDAESYVNDQIMGRDFWVAMKAWSERLSGKQENNGIYFAKDGTWSAIWTPLHKRPWPRTPAMSTSWWRMCLSRSILD